MKIDENIGIVMNLAAPQTPVAVAGLHCRFSQSGGEIGHRRGRTSPIRMNELIGRYHLGPPPTHLPSEDPGGWPPGVWVARPVFAQEGSERR